METTLIYFSVKVLSATYILYKVWMFIFSPKVYNFWDSQLRHMRIARIRLWKSRKKRMAKKARKARYRARLSLKSGMKRKPKRSRIHWTSTMKLSERQK